MVLKINGETVKDENSKVICQVVNGQVSVDYTIPDSYKEDNYTITATYWKFGRLTCDSTM